jgi:hypothetical protein
MVSNEIIIEGKLKDRGRPKERPPKTNWKVEMLKKGVGLLQHIAPNKAGDIVWHHFTKPGRSRFNEKQQALINQFSFNNDFI